MPPKAAGKAKKGKRDENHPKSLKEKADSAKKSKKEKPEAEGKEVAETDANVLEKTEDETLALVLSSHSMPAFDRVVANAELVIRSLEQEAKHILATQVGKLIDYCVRLKDDVESKNQMLEELQPKIEEANNRMAQALNVSVISEKTVKGLQNELENAWREVDASRLREQAFQEQITELYKQMSTMEGKVKSSPRSHAMGEIADVGPLSKKKGTILRERDRLQAEVEELEKRLQMQRLYSENVEKHRQVAESTNQALVQELESSDTKKTKSKRLLDDVASNLEKARDENIVLVKKICSLQAQVEEVEKLYEGKSIEVQNIRSNYEKLKSEQSSWNKILSKRSAALNTCVLENQSLTEQLRSAINKLKAKEYELSEIKADCKKSMANYDLLANRLSKMSNTRVVLEKNISTLKDEILSLRKECALTVKTVETERRDKGMVIYERDTLRGTIAKLTNAKKDLEHTLVSKNNTVVRLQDEIVKNTLKYDELKQDVDITRRERDRNDQEIQMLRNKVDDLHEDVTLKTEQINSMKNLLVEKQLLYTKIKQNLASTNSERLILRQQLQAFTEERDKLEIQFSHVSHQVSQLKEEVTKNQNRILASTTEIEKLTKDKQDLKMEIRNKATLLEKVRNELRYTKKENDRLYKSLSDDERRLMKQAAKLDSTEHEKDLIGSQMIRRNNEIMLLKEQISILEIAMQRGQMQYNRRIEDIKLLKQEVMRMRSQRNILTRGLANTVEMRQEVLQLNRQLLQERITNSALKEEAVSAMNIHRWRPLAGRDPERMELIRKIILLQKRIFRMQLQASKREKELQQTHKLYNLLKDYIEKLPSYKVKEDLIESQRVLKIRSRKLKALTAELNAKDAEIQARDCTIEELQNTLNKSKKAVNELTKKEIPRKEDGLTGSEGSRVRDSKNETLETGFTVHRA